MGKRTDFANPSEETESKKKVYLTFVLDESYSMSIAREQTISGMNEQIDQVKKEFDAEDIETIVSFIKFSDKVEPVFLNKELSELKHISAEDYLPNNNTALYDAVGMAVSELRKRKDIDDKNTTVLITVISDGEENASREYKAKDIADMVKEAQDTERWTFTYLGSEMDLASVKEATGYAAGNMAFFDTTSAVGYTQAFNAHSHAMSNFSASVRRSKSAVATKSFYATPDAETQEPSETK